MVLVAVGDDDRLDVLHPLAQVREVGQHEVDAHHLGGREPQPAVDHDDAVVVLDDRQVLPDLADASKREDAQLAAHAAWTPLSKPVALEGGAHDRELGLVGLHQRQPQAADVVAEQVQGGLDRDRARGAEHRVRRRRAARRRSRRGAPARRTSGASRCRRRGWRRRCRPRRRGRGSGRGPRRCRSAPSCPSIGPRSAALDCLTASIPSIWRQLGEQLAGRGSGSCGSGCCRRSPGVAAGRARDLLVVADDAAAVRAVVVAGDRQQRLGAGRRHPLGEVRRRGACCWSPRRRRSVASSPSSSTIERDQRDHLVVAQRRRLAGRPAHDEPVRAVGEQVPAERDAPPPRSRGRPRGTG